MAEVKSAHCPSTGVWIPALTSDSSQPPLNSSFSGSLSLFWPLWAPAFICRHSLIHPRTYTRNTKLSIVGLIHAESIASY